MPFRDDLTQHHGFLAGAVVTAIADVACGYAAMTLMPPGASVLTVEYKVNFPSPARGRRMPARGRVVRPGRMVAVCSGDVVALGDGGEKPIATHAGHHGDHVPGRCHPRPAERRSERRRVGAAIALMVRVSRPRAAAPAR